MTDGAVSERWQRLLDEANGTGAGMNLASANGKSKGGGKGGAGGEPNLKNEKNPWTVASGSLESLKNNLNRALTEMRTGQHGAGTQSKGTSGFESAGVQERVFNSWEARLELVRDECREVSGKLDKAGNHLVKGDQDIEAMFGKYEAKPTPPPGGPSGSW